MSHKNCITLRQFLETYYKDECEVCQRTIKEIIKILNLKENDLVYLTTVYCCALTEGGSCTIPLPCPKELYRVEHEVDYDMALYAERKIKKWYEWWCIMNMLNGKYSCHRVETNKTEFKRESEYASSKEEVVEILKKFGLNEEIAEKLIQEVQ